MKDNTCAETQIVGTCPRCGTRTHSTGTCPACALSDLLGSTGERVADLGGEPGADGTGGLVGERYVLKERMAGGMGVVYVAEDRKLRRTVALKMIRGATFADDSERTRFRVETEAAAALNHPNIVPIYEVGEIDGQPFFTMMLVEGETLAELLKRLNQSGQKLPEREAAKLLEGIARAVHHAHRHGVLHRDLKPGNILIDTEGNPWLTDFGLAKLTHSESGVTLTTDALGTPDYMSPEVAGGNVREASTASDVWALGVILWEMLFRAPPFRGSGAVETMRRIVESEPSKRKGLHADEDLVTLAVRCLEKNPGRRLNSAGELVNELVRWGRGLPIRARRITGRERLWKWARRNRALAALYVTLVAGFCASLFFWQRAEVAVDSLEKSNAQLGKALGISNAHRLAVEARIHVEESPSLALLLAVESADSGEASVGHVLPESAESLTAVLQQVGGFDVSPMEQKREWPDDGFIMRAPVTEFPLRPSPDGRWLMTPDFTEWQDNGVSAAVFDLKDGNGGRPVSRFTVSDTLMVPQAMRWLPDSQRIISVTEGGEVRLWEAVSKDGAANLNEVPHRVLGSVQRLGKTVRNVRIIAGPTGEAKALAILYSKGDQDAEGWGYETYLGWYPLGEGGDVFPDPETVALQAFGLGSGFLHVSDFSPDCRWILIRGVENVVGARLAKLSEAGEMSALIDLGTGTANEPVFDRSGRKLAFIDGGGAVRIFGLSRGDDTTAEQIREFSSVGIRHFDFSPKGKWLGVVGESSEVLLVPTVSEEPGDTVSLRLEGGGAYVVGFSPDGRWVVVGGEDRTVSAWRMPSIRTAPRPAIYRGLTTAVLDVQFSPGSDHLFATGLHCLHRRWPLDGENAAAVPEVLSGTPASINEVAVSADGAWVATAGVDNTKGKRSGPVKWIASDGGDEILLGFHGERATAVAFSSDGRWFASTGADGFANLWRVENIERANALGEASPSPDHVLDMTDTRLQFWRNLAFHPRGTLYATCGDGVLFEWDTNAPNPEETRQFHVIHSQCYLLPDLAVSPDGSKLAVCRQAWDEPEEGSAQHGSQVILFDVSQPGAPEPLAHLQGHFFERAAVDFSPDGRWLALGGAGAGAQVWDLEAKDIGKSVRTSPFSSHRMPGIAFDPEGRWLACAGDNGRIHLWGWRTPGDIRTTLTNTAVESLAWADDKKLISGGARGHVAVWQTDTAELRRIARKIAGRELSEVERKRYKVPE